MAENVVPVLVLNKLDRLIVELRLSPEEMYQRLHAVVDNVNAMIEASSFPRVVSPLNGTVLFASGKQSWGFSLPQLAKSLAKKTGASEETLLSCMWGDMFFNSETKKWSKSSGPGKVRGFCKLVVEGLLKGYLALHEKENNAESVFQESFVVPLGLSGLSAPSAAVSMHNVLPLADVRPVGSILCC